MLLVGRETCNFAIKIEWLLTSTNKNCIFLHCRLKSGVRMQKYVDTQLPSYSLCSLILQYKIITHSKAPALKDHNNRASLVVSRILQ